VIASRIGGLPYTVADGATGLLFEPGNVDDLARKLTVLLDDPPLRRRMGLAGRRRFEEDFRWDVVIKRYYRPLLGRRARTGANPSRP
jgi:glycosyltransferase involved in cell wall biosynthesis